jgi:hypothetical protein
MERLVSSLMVWAALGVLGYYIAARKGRPGCEGLVLGLFFGPLGVLLLALLPPMQQPTANAGVAETSPLPSFLNASFKTYRTGRPRVDLLVLKPTITVRVVGIILIQISLSLFIFTIRELHGLLVLKLLFGAVGGAVGIIFTFLGLRCCDAPHFEFDRDAGTMRTRRFFSSRIRPLSDIVQVQLIDGDPMRDYCTYQLNLVLADQEHSRLNLTDHASRKATRQAGALLATFLNVPLQDEIGCN